MNGLTIVFFCVLAIPAAIGVWHMLSRGEEEPHYCQGCKHCILISDDRVRCRKFQNVEGIEYCSEKELTDGR